MCLGKSCLLNKKHTAYSLLWIGLSPVPKERGMMLARKSLIASLHAHRQSILRLWRKLCMILNHAELCPLEGERPAPLNAWCAIVERLKTPIDSFRSIWDRARLAEKLRFSSKCWGVARELANACIQRLIKTMIFKFLWNHTKTNKSYSKPLNYGDIERRNGFSILKKA